MAHSVSSREVIELLKRDGWYPAGVTGDHFQGTSKNPITNTERVIPENFIFDYRSLARDNRNEIYPESDLVFVVSSNR